MQKQSTVKFARIDGPPNPEQGRYRNGTYLLEIIEERGRTDIRLSFVESADGNGEVGSYQVNALDLIQYIQESTEPLEYEQFNGDDAQAQAYTSEWPKTDDDDDNVVFVDFRDPIMVAEAMRHGFKPVDMYFTDHADFPVYGPYTVNFLLSKLRNNRSAKTFRYMSPDGSIEERSIMDEIIAVLKK